MRKKKTFVIGHRNPDTDSICSAIAYAKFRELRGENNVIAARAGDVNQQTAFALKYFKVDAPLLLSDITPKVMDYMTADVISMPTDTTIKKLVDTMEEKKLRSIPLTNEKGEYFGLVTFFDLMLGLKKLANPDTCLNLKTSVKHLKETLRAKAITCVDSDGCFDGAVHIGAMKVNTFLERMSNEESQRCIVLTGNREKIQRAAIEDGVHCLIVTGGHEVNKEIELLAKKRGVNLLISPYDTATSLGLVHLSAPAHTLSSYTEQHLKKEQLLSTVKSDILNSETKRMVVVNEDKTIAGIITSADILEVNNVQIVMVDHNELRQSVAGIEEAEIIEIIDHHRLGNAHTNSPISFINEPLGSTCTIVARRYFAEDMEMSKEVAGLLISGIISDTLFLKSPTATKTDKDTIERLNKTAKINIEEYANALLGAGAKLEGRSAKEIITEDFKEYQVSNGKFGVGQVEVIGFAGISKKKDEIKETLELIINERGLSFIGLLVTDITYSNSQFFFSGTRSFTSKIDYPILEEKISRLDGIVSRKKQVIPHLLNLFK